MTEVIGVRFRGGCKEYYFDPHGIAVEAGQFVIVETAQGTEYAQCLTGNHEVDDGAVVRPLRALVRIATENDPPHHGVQPSAREGCLRHLPAEDRRARAGHEARARGVQL